MDGKVIKLSTPVEAFGKPVAEIVLREPKGGLFSRLGLPRVTVYNQSGSAYLVDQNEVIAAYLDALVELEAQMKPAVLGQLALADSLRLREALFEYFTEAESKVSSLR